MVSSMKLALAARPTARCIATKASNPAGPWARAGAAEDFGLETAALSPDLVPILASSNRPGTPRTRRADRGPRRPRAVRCRRMATTRDWPALCQGHAPPRRAASRTGTGSPGGSATASALPKSSRARHRSPQRGVVVRQVGFACDLEAVIDPVTRGSAIPRSRPARIRRFPGASHQASRNPRAGRDRRHAATGSRSSDGDGPVVV